MKTVIYCSSRHYLGGGNSLLILRAVSSYILLSVSSKRIELFKGLPKVALELEGSSGWPNMIPVFAEKQHSLGNVEGTTVRNACIC